MIGSSIKRALVALSFATLAASNSYAANPPGTVTFSGAGFIYAVNSTCTSLGYSVGDFYTTTYRYKSDPSGPIDVLAIFSLRSAFHIAANNSTGSLLGSTATTNTYIGTRGGLATGLTGSTNLAIGSAGGNPTATAVNLKVVGTIDNFQDNPGCTITFHADLAARPN